VTRRLEILMWVSLFGAPVAWASSHVFGWLVSEARCETVNHQWGVATTTWETALLVVSFALALGGLAASIIVFRKVKNVDMDADPPAGRLWILSISALTVSSLMVVVILLTHIAALSLTPCTY
jgi:uncharacterized Tic20 family protein